MHPDRIRTTLRRTLAISLLGALAALGAPSGDHAEAHGKQGKAPKNHFRRIATFPVFQNTDISTQTVAEIVSATEDGKTLLYTDSANGTIGFVDISDSSHPLPGGTVDVGGEPTSVGCVDGYALACVNTSPSYASPSGNLVVIDVATHSIVRTLALGGQPDCIAISPDKHYAAIAIENERDEELGDGAPPQLPAGFVVVVSLAGAPAAWTTNAVSLVGIPDKFPTDPEPEYVDINKDNIAAVTLQENNHVVLIDVEDGSIVGDFSCGTVTLDHVDVIEDDLITLDGTLIERPREPDAVAWIDDDSLATADEGDLEGGTRGFTIFNKDGTIEFEAGTVVEHAAVRSGHYPEARSENKGSEPEAVAYARYGNEDLLFVGSERANIVSVFRLGAHGTPHLHQVLPAGVGPEGFKAIPKRNLFVAASEEDARGDVIRSSISIYEWKKQSSIYPTVESADDENGTPIPWAALSALAGSASDSGQAYTVWDSYFQQSRIFALDVSTFPAVITEAIVLRAGGVTVDLDPEGLSVAEGGGFWLASEGAGSVDDPGRPVTSTNQIFRVAADGTILDTIDLPAAVNARQRRFGFEGVSAVGSGATETLYVAFQREWVGDPAGLIRIGIYDVTTEGWSFVYYPREMPTSPNGGWVGLSEIVSIDGTRFAVIERDNQGGADARIKRIYEFSLAGVTPVAEGGVFPTLDKWLVRDLIPDLQAGGGPVLEKVEGLTILANGDVLICTDNDGVDDASGETQFLNLGDLFDLSDEKSEGKPKSRKSESRGRKRVVAMSTGR